MYTGGVNLCSGPDTLSEDEMKAFLSSTSIEGFEASTTQPTTSVPLAWDSINNIPDTKVLCFQTRVATAPIHAITLPRATFDILTAPSQANAAFSLSLHARVCHYLANSTLMDHFKMALKVERAPDNLVYWSLPNPVLAPALIFRLHLSPFFQNYFLPPNSPVPATTKSIMDLKRFNGFQWEFAVPDLQQGTRHFWLTTNPYPMRYTTQFPLRLIHEGNLFGDNFISGGNHGNHHLYSRIVASFHWINGKFELIFNPNLIPRSVDSLSETQSFALINAQGRRINIEPTLSTIWFELGCF